MKTFILLSIILVNTFLLFLLACFCYFKGLSIIFPSQNFFYKLLLLYFILLMSFSTLFFIIIKRKKFLALRYLLNLFYNIIMIFAKIFCIPNKKIRISYIKLNNKIASFSFQKPYNSSEILILLPHCLQSSKCNIRVTKNINNCKECGACDIGEMKKIADKYKIKMSIAMGGTLARQIVGESKPKLILACACYRDLSEGIKDTYPFLVYGFSNKIVKKSCEDTKIDYLKVDSLIKKLL